MRRAAKRTRTIWRRARASAVAPIGLVVGVAIIAIVIAVLTSAHRADEVAVYHEQRLFMNVLANRRAQVVREVQNIATSDTAVRRLWVDFDRNWVHMRVGLRLKSYFEHDYVFVLDVSDRYVYALLGNKSVDPGLFGSALSDLSAVIDAVRGRRAPVSADLEAAIVDPKTGAKRPASATRVQKFMGQPAIVAAVALVPEEGGVAVPSGPSPLIVTVEVIDAAFLQQTGSRLKLAHLREIEGPPPAGDQMLDLLDDEGKLVARFAWTPTRPGAEIVSHTLPFIAVALAGLALLAGLIVRHMRRTAAAISEGEDRMRHLALHDALSGLPNRAYFAERLEGMIERVNRGGSAGAVFCIDLDHFKDVNDTLGHHVGDELIGAVTKRLRHLIRDEALVARLGGDEFAVITPGATDSSTLTKIADRIIASLCAPYSIAGHTIVIGASIGIAIIDRPSLRAADIMRYADMALYRAKNEGRRRACIYDDAMNADLVQRKQLEHDLREAVENDGLHLLYQPVFNAAGEKVAGVEALARWNHPTRGAIPPAEFIPIAEHSGLIIALGEWALRRACLDAVGWPISLAVNVSPLQFRRPDFVEMVQRILHETGFEASRLELEITESTLLGNVEGAESAMRQLKALGVRLALDDFGTGYSSLLYLRRFPFDKLKIDRSFVRSIESAAEAAPIVHAIVSLGRGLGMKVTAEGVETAEQHLFLRAAGVHFMQGFRFGKPETTVQIARRLADQNARGDVPKKPLAQAS
jgi:diguanylate cyclase (GGDEF)-like protein